MKCVCRMKLLLILLLFFFWTTLTYTGDFGPTVELKIFDTNFFLGITMVIAGGCNRCGGACFVYPGI